MPEAALAHEILVLPPRSTEDREHSKFHVCLVNAISPASGIRSGHEEGTNKKCCLTKWFSLRTEMEVMRREL